MDIYDLPEDALHPRRANQTYCFKRTWTAHLRASRANIQIRYLVSLVQNPLMLTSVSNAGPTPDMLSPAKEQHGPEQMLHTKSGGGIKQIQAEQNWSSISWLRVRQGELRLPEEPIYPNI